MVLTISNHPLPNSTRTRERGYQFRAKGCAELSSLGVAGDIAPELGGAQHRAALSERHQPVLLPTDADAPHPGPVTAPERQLGRLFYRLGEIARLFLVKNCQTQCLAGANSCITGPTHSPHAP